MLPFARTNRPVTSLGLSSRRRDSGPFGQRLCARLTAADGLQLYRTDYYRRRQRGDDHQRIDSYLLPPSKPTRNDLQEAFSGLLIVYSTLRYYLLLLGEGPRTGLFQEVK